MVTSTGSLSFETDDRAFLREGATKGVFMLRTSLRVLAVGILTGALYSLSLNFSDPASANSRGKGAGQFKGGGKNFGRGGGGRQFGNRGGGRRDFRGRGFGSRGLGNRRFGNNDRIGTFKFFRNQGARFGFNEFKNNGFNTFNGFGKNRFGQLGGGLGGNGLGAALANGDIDLSNPSINGDINVGPGDETRIPGLRELAVPGQTRPAARIIRVPNSLKTLGEERADRRAEQFDGDEQLRYFRFYRPTEAYDVRFPSVVYLDPS